MKYQYDFVFSFAGEDRAIVEQVLDILKENGLRVFYDFERQHELLGKNLAEHFANIYENSAKYCVVYVSQNYLKKQWCNWERRSALTRAFKSKQEYILPYFLEDCNLPSVPEIIGKAELKNLSPKEFALLLVKKYFANIDITDLASSDVLNEAMLQKFALQRENEENKIYSKTPVKTHFSSIDEKLRYPLSPGNICLIGSCASIGKTTFALNIVDRNIQAGVPVIYLSTEESSADIFLKLLGIHTHVSMTKLRQGLITEEEKNKIRRASEIFQKAPLQIISQQNEPVFDRILCELWRVTKEKTPSLIVIDSLQSIMKEEFFGTNRNIGLKTILAGLKWLSLKTNVTYIVLTRLKQSVEKRDDKTPKITDLPDRESIFPYLETIFMLYRKDYYDASIKDEPKLQILIGKPNVKNLKSVKLRFKREELRLLDEWEVDEQDMAEVEKEFPELFKND